MSPIDNAAALSPMEDGASSPRPPDPGQSGFDMTCQELELARTEISRLNAELSRIRRHLQETQKLTLAGSYEIRLPGRSLSWSDEVFEILGLDPVAEPPSLQLFLDLVLAEDRHMVERVLAQALDHHDPYQLEYRLQIRGGVTRYVQDAGEVIPDVDGSGELLIGTLRDITEHKQTEIALQRQSVYQSALYDVALGLVNRLEVEPLLRSIVVRAGHLLNTPHNYLYLVDDEKDEIVAFIVRGIFAGQEGYHMKRGEGLAGKAWDSSETVVIDDYDTWPERSPRYPYGVFHAGLAIPLRFGERVYGVIGLAHIEPDHPFSADEIDVLTRFSHLASITLTNAKLYSDSQQQLAERLKAEHALRESEERFRMVSGLTSDYAYAVRVNEKGGHIYEWITEAFPRLTGYTWQEAEALGGWSRLVLADDTPVLQRRAEKIRSGEKCVSEYRILTKGGEQCWLRDIVYPQVDEKENRVVLFFGAVQDVTAQKRAEEQLRQAYLDMERRNRQLAQILEIGYTFRVNLNLETLLDEIVQATSRFLDFEIVVMRVMDPETGNLRVRAQCGLDERGRRSLESSTLPISEFQKLMQDQFLLSNCYFIPYGAFDWQEYHGPTYIAEQASRETGPGSEWPIEQWHPEDVLFVPINLQEGGFVGFLSLDMPRDGKRPKPDVLQGLGIFANQASITIENSRLYAEVHRLAITDGLTGIYNRAFFESELVRLQDSQLFPISIMVIDVDNMKTTNDRLGHAAGDELLKRAVQVLRDSFRAEDMIARIGGDEFAVLLSGVGAVRAQEVITRVTAIQEESNRLNKDLPALSLSLGIATGDLGSRLSDVLRQADAHMYAAKVAHKSSVRL